MQVRCYLENVAIYDMQDINCKELYSYYAISHMISKTGALSSDGKNHISLEQVGT
jgi:hypothetical protein